MRLQHRESRYTLTRSVYWTTQWPYMLHIYTGSLTTEASPLESCGRHPEAKTSSEPNAVCFQDPYVLECGHQRLLCRYSGVG